VASTCAAPIAGVCRVARVSGPAEVAVAALCDLLGEGPERVPPAMVLYFCAGWYPPRRVVPLICERFPDSLVVGCSTPGQFTGEEIGCDGISAIALPHDVVGACAAAVTGIRPDVQGDADQAVEELETQLGFRLASLDRRRYVLLALGDAGRDPEDRVDSHLRRFAPRLRLVVGSVGDDLAFQGEWVAVGASVRRHGMALIVMEPRVGFHELRAAGFTGRGRPLRIGKADTGARVVHTLNDRPAVNVYAETLAMSIAEVDAATLLKHPLGLRRDGESWVCSPLAVTADGGLLFSSPLAVGTWVQVMDQVQVQDQANAIRAARSAVGGAVSGAVIIDCILAGWENARPDRQVLTAVDGVAAAGFYTYGDTWRGHPNRGLEGLLFGSVSRSSHQR